MGNLPSGTVTFLFTDVEGSTRLAQQYPDSISGLLERHHAILKNAIEAHGGYIFQIIGDAFCAAFQTVREALDAALDAQWRLTTETWSPEPIRVRMGISTGSAQVKLSEDRPPDYAGYLNLARVQRVMSVAYGGQILLANTSVELVRGELPPNVCLQDLGEHRLNSLLNPEHLWQVAAPGLQAEFPVLQSLNTIPNNLPVQLTSFIGREREIDEVKKLLETHRLVTLTGVGGTGKSRLALQVAADVLNQFDHGIWFVELAPISDPALIAQTVIRLLGLTVSPGRESLDVLKDYLSDKSLLLMLDNCEHLLDDSCRFADAILRAAARVKIMATSREALNLAGEQAYRVPSLSAPNVNNLPPLDHLTQFEAIRLFIERATLVSPGFAVTNGNALGVAQICHRLDGIPLAIELAAARVQSMPLEAIVSRLDDRFRLLTGGSRTALPRQQTLRAMIDWSYNLLSEGEKPVFRRLSVFRGGWNLEAADAICSGEGIQQADALELVSRLMDKSLVYLDEQQRYQMLETVRQYAAERLIESGQAESVRDQHLKYMLEWVEQAEPYVDGPDQSIWLDRLDAELDNIRAAMQWAQVRNPVICLRIASALWRFWFVRSSYLFEGIDWLTRALELTQGANTVHRARALERLAGLCCDFPDRKVAEGYARAAYELSEALHDQFGMALALARISFARLDRDPETAIAIAEQCEKLATELREPSIALHATFLMALAAKQLNDLARARSLLEATIAAERAGGDPRALSMELMQLAQVCLSENDPESAQALLQEAWPYLQEARDYRAMCMNRLWLADAVLFRDQFERARRLQEEGHELAQASNDSSLLIMTLESEVALEVVRGDSQAIHDRARARLELARQLRLPRDIRGGLLVMADAERRLGDVEQARQAIVELLPQFEQDEQKPALRDGAYVLAFIALAAGRPRRAARLFAAEARLRGCLFQYEFPCTIREREKAIAETRAQLGEEAFNEAWAEGQAMTEEELLSYAIEARCRD